MELAFVGGKLCIIASALSQGLRELENHFARESPWCKGCAQLAPRDKFIIPLTRWTHKAKKGSDFKVVGI